MMERPGKLRVDRPVGRRVFLLVWAGLGLLVAAVASLVADVAWPGMVWPRIVALGSLGLALPSWGMAWRIVRRRLRDHARMLARLRASERRAVREAAARHRLLAAVSHELRTPLHGLLGTLALLRGTPLNAEQQNHLQTLDVSARMLLSMVEELLEQARLEGTGESALENRPFDPARLVEEVCELLAPRAHARGLEVATFVAPQVRGRYVGDALRLKQVLLNLLGNAVKFTTQGGVLVRLEKAEKGLRFEVEDTGPGVPPALEQRLFDAFVRDESGDVAREGGAGLGLAISQRLVRRMGGRLALDNRPGRGARFHFTLPLRPVAEDVPETDMPSRSAARVLLLAPEGPVRQALADLAAACGAEVHLARDAVRHLPENTDVIVDARLEHLLPALLARSARARVLRVWLLLRPEDRIRLHDWLNDPRLSGYLLRPVRRRTFLKLLSGEALERMAEHSVRRLRALARSARSAAQETRPLVVLAEDDPVSAKVARALLERMGCRVAHVADGVALVRMVEGMLERPERERPVCALVDVHMPGLDGIEAAQAIRRLEADRAASRMPILALSGGGAEERGRCLAAGMDGFLRKPVEPEALRAALAPYLARAESGAVTSKGTCGR